MRDLLFLSYYVPPREGVASLRTKQLIAHLPDFGWRVTAVTPPLEGAQADVVQTDYVDVRAVVKERLGIGSAGAHEALGSPIARHGQRRSLRQWAIETGFVVLGYPDGAVGWIPGARRAVRRLLASGRYSAVLSSAPPFTTNVILGSMKLGIPWVADFRDLWTDTDAHESPLRRRCDAILEHWSLRCASALTTISGPMAEALRRRHPRQRVEIIPNAFDAAEWNDVPFETENRCTFLYAGTFHAGRRDPSLLFHVTRTLIDRGALIPDEMHIDFYAPVEPWLTSLIDRFGLNGIVRVLGNVPREKVLNAERRADRLLVVLWDSPGSEGTVTGKFFEYLGARRRIIAIGGPSRSAIDDLLRSTGAGRRCTSDTALSEELMAAVEQHRRRSVSVLPESAVTAFEAHEIARQFSALIEHVVTHKV